METPVETGTEKEKRSINWGALILWPLVILFFYVLSIGPVAVLLEKEHISHDNKFLRMLYVPMKWAYNDTPLHKPLGMYLHLWVPRSIDKSGDGIPSAPGI